MRLNVKQQLLSCLLSAVMVLYLVLNGGGGTEDFITTPALASASAWSEPSLSLPVESYQELKNIGWETPPPNNVFKNSSKAPEVKALSVPAEALTKPTAAIQSVSGLTAAQINQILAGTVLAKPEIATAILNVEDNDGVNAFFTIAVMVLESAYGKSEIAQKKNNLFGLNALDGDVFHTAFSFKTKQDCILKFGQLISAKYINEGYTTVEAIGGKYCPANSDWAKSIQNIMEKDYKMLQRA